MAFHKMTVDARRTRIASLLLDHLTEGEISRRLKVHRNTVSKDVAVLRSEWRERRGQDTDAWIGEELARLAEAERMVWPKVRKQDLFAVDRLLAIMERRARYLGLDAQPDAAPVAQMQVVVLNGNADRIAAPGSLAAVWRSGGTLLAG